MVESGANRRRSLYHHSGLFCIVVGSLLAVVAQVIKYFDDSEWEEGYVKNLRGKKRTLKA